LYTSFIIDVPQLVIYVGHSNYKIDEIQGTGITFQYVDILEMYEGEMKDITAYVSGNGAVTAEIWADEKNISVLNLYDNGAEMQSPLSFTSTNTTERISRSHQSTERRDNRGYVSNHREWYHKTYMTRIGIGPPQSGGRDTGVLFR
jgi:hypothetical protein